MSSCVNRSLIPSTHSCISPPQPCKISPSLCFIRRNLSIVISMKLLPSFFFYDSPIHPYFHTAIILYTSQHDRPQLSPVLSPSVLNPIIRESDITHRLWACLLPLASYRRVICIKKGDRLYLSYINGSILPVSCSGRSGLFNSSSVMMHSAVP